MMESKPLSWPKFYQDSPVSGKIKQNAEDFRVFEHLAFEPSGTGEHLLIRLEKKNLSAFALVARLAERLGIKRDEIGVAGLKDTRAICQQWVSVPKSAASLAVLEQVGCFGDEIQVLRVCAHPHKLRVGVVRKNTFEIRLRSLVGDNIQATLQRRWEELGKLGLINAFGAQRFGRDGETLRIGFDLLRGSSKRIEKGLRRLALSAVQSSLFNTWLQWRLEEQTLHQAVLGDVMMVVQSGGPFWAEDLAEIQTRLDARTIVVSGPIYGPKMRQARKMASGLEERVLSESGLTIDAFAQQKKLCLGTRRAAIVWPELNQIHWEDDSTCVVSFALPTGSYATELLGALLNNCEQ